MYLKQGELFLMTGKKRPNNKTSNYLVSMGEGDTKRSSKNYLGERAARRPPRARENPAPSRRLSGLGGR